MNVYFTDEADMELKNWIKSDKNVAKKIHELIEDIQTNGLAYGKGKPERLRHYKNPVRFSRRITHGDRLVYSPYDSDDLLVISCKGHYED